MKLSPRSSHKESLRRLAVQAAPIAEKYPELETLTVAFAYHAPDRSSRNREVKFSVNIERASSRFHVECLNHECVGGDYDLSEILAEAVANREQTVSGELQCQGWRDRWAIDRVKCRQRITFKLTLAFRGQPTK